MNVEIIKEEIRDLKEKKNAIILAHNYQRPDIQDIADYLGDSLGLSKEASRTDADIIVFCGVLFMAETTKILSPQKRVLQPRIEAGCELANKVTLDDLRKTKEKYPDARVVSYVNSSAEIKAESDVCCTSSNAINVVKNIDSNKVIFVPDRNLALYVQRFVDKNIIPWNGYCYVHENIKEIDVIKAKEKYPDALVVVHPECSPPVIDLVDKVLSTGGMVKFAREKDNKRFLIGTEKGIIYRLKKENPQKEFYPIKKGNFCWDMKMTSLKDVYISLLDERYEIDLEEDVISRSKRALEKMLEYS